MAERKATRRQVLKVAGVAAGVAASPWWLVKTSHAQRAKKLVFWHQPNFTPLADELQKQQVYEFAKQAGIKDTEVEYATVAGEQFTANRLASRLATRRRTRLYESNGQYYAAGPLLSQRRREKMLGSPMDLRVVHVRGPSGALHGGSAARDPLPVHARLDLLDQASSITETGRVIEEQSPARPLYASACALAVWTHDTVMNPRGAMAQDVLPTTEVVMRSPRTWPASRLSRPCSRLTDHPPVAISCDNSAQQAYQSSMPRS